MAAIGIDLGNKFARVAVLRSRSVELILDENGNAKTPCFVAFTNEGDRLIGLAAKDQLLANPRNTFFNAKRLLNQDIYNEEWANIFFKLPFLLDKFENGNLAIKMIHNDEVRLLRPEEIIGSILHRMKMIAEKNLNTSVTDAVISVPASFNGIQRQATLHAGKIAGFTGIRLFNEPTAAILGHWSQNGTVEGMKLLFHLGSGSFDVSVIKVTAKTYRVIATSGDPQLGGDNFTEELMTKLKYSVLGINFEKSPSDLEILRTECERVKIKLASNEKELLKFQSADGLSTTTQNVSIAHYEGICENILKKIQLHLELVLKNAGLKPADVDQIFLTGEATNVPFVKKLLLKMFAEKKLHHLEDSAVALGCAVQTGLLGGRVKDLMVTDICVNQIVLNLPHSCVCLEVVHKDCQIPHEYKIVLYPSVHTGTSPLKFNLFENTFERQLLLNESLITFQDDAKLGSKYELKVLVNADGICQCSATTVLPNGEALQLQMSKICPKNMLERDIERAALEIVRHHNSEENARRCRLAKEEFHHTLCAWNTPFKMIYNDEFALKFRNKLFDEAKWLADEKENDANVVERRLAELELFCTITLQDAIGNIPPWVKNLYDIKLCIPQIGYCSATEDF